MELKDELVQLQRAPHIERPIDNTALDTTKCWRKYLLSMVWHRRSGRLTEALAYGTWWHLAMEVHYKSGGDVALVEYAVMNSRKTHDNPEDHRTKERCVAAYKAWIKEWGPTFEQEQLAWGTTLGWPDTPIIEKVATLSWDGSIHPYTGKIDRIYEKDGAYYVEDHKTTSALGKTFFRQFDPSNQMMGYAWLAHLLTGLPIAGVRINAHGVLKTENKFERQTIMYSPERLEEWARRIQDRLLEVEERSAEMAQLVNEGMDPFEAGDIAFGPNFNACDGKYGMCSYVEYCTMPLLSRQAVLESDYPVSPWDPNEGEE